MENSDSLENTSDSNEIPKKSRLENLEAIAGIVVLSTGAIAITALTTLAVGYKISEIAPNYFY